MEAAGPSTPVEVMGFDDVPSAGDEVIAVGDDKLSPVRWRRSAGRSSRRPGKPPWPRCPWKTCSPHIEEGKQLTLNLIIKADVQGSVEAVQAGPGKAEQRRGEACVCCTARAGAITKDDVNLASAFNAIIIGFNIRPDASARASRGEGKGGCAAVHA